LEELKFELLDASGRLVAERPVARYPPGSHRVSWSIGRTPPGVYFLRMRSFAGESAHAKLIVLP
jgi:hypothetical protein